MRNQTNKIRSWIGEIFQTQDFSVTQLRGDASFRHFYRVKTQDNQWILMDAPPNKEPIEPFIQIAQSWHKQGILVPEIRHFDIKQGLVLMTDFNDQLLQDILNNENVDHFYQRALEALPTIQGVDLNNGYTYPRFDENHIRLELSYFKDWFLQQLLTITISQSEEKLLQKLFERLILACQQQPQVVIHLDYHSRNLMVIDQNTLGIIDFQDAKIGPLAYDAVSLLRDCYINWPIEQTYGWLETFYLQHQKPIHKTISFEQMKEWFDMVGLQRHLKVLGIFSRLNLRDKKPGYLKDIPRIIDYVLQVTSQYPEFLPFEQWLSVQVIPKLQKMLETTGASLTLHLPKQAGSAK